MSDEHGDERYNVYFAGQLLPGRETGEVRARLGQLFKADDATLDRLFSGTPQLVKRLCDRPTALKYKQALEQAGARPVIKRGDPGAGSRAAARDKAPTQHRGAAEAEGASASRQTMAERVAALAAATPTKASPPQPQPQLRPRAGEEAGDGAMTLAPAGADLLRPEERQRPAPRAVDTSALALGDPGERLSARPPPPPPAPDTSHFSLGAPGEDIPTLASDIKPVNPDISALDLAPAETGLNEGSAPATPPPSLDLSAIELAPAGSEVLEARYRRAQPGEPPDVSHIQLEDHPPRA